MSVINTMKNPLFTAKDLYAMVRLSMIKYFPYPASDMGADEALTVYMQKALELDIHVQLMQDERGLIFRGKSYDVFKDMEHEERGPDHSPAWYVTQVAKWRKHDIFQLHEDLNVMRNWLYENDYVKDGIPTDKFLKQEFLIISDAAAETRKAQRSG